MAKTAARRQRERVQAANRAKLVAGSRDDLPSEPAPLGAHLAVLHQSSAAAAARAKQVFPIIEPAPIAIIYSALPPPLKIQDPCIALQAKTHPSAVAQDASIEVKMHTHYRQLEWLGDIQVARFISEKIVDQEVVAPHEERDAARKRLTQNRTFAHLARHYRLQRSCNVKGDLNFGGGDDGKGVCSDAWEAHLGGLYEEARQQPHRRHDVDVFMHRVFCGSVFPDQAGMLNGAKEREIRTEAQNLDDEAEVDGWMVVEEEEDD